MPTQNAIQYTESSIEKIPAEDQKNMTGNKRFRKNAVNDFLLKIEDIASA